MKRWLKKLFWFEVVFVLALSVVWIARIAEGRCTWCPTYKCFGSCPSGCVCITPPGQVGGNCYGVENAPRVAK